jgi:Raf kinase inhibitor-like YbhB/YbcL family protein
VRGRWGAALVCAGVMACSSGASEPPTKLTPTGRSDVQVQSSAFGANQPIPRVYTCEGDDRSPPLAWSGAPPGTKSFVVIVDDPDAPDPKAPKMTWVHWVVYDVPPTTTALAEGLSRLPDGAKSGKNDWKRVGYGGPCPPVGRHRYFHKVYALDITLGDLGEPSKAAVEAAMEGHILASGELVGTYEKGAR